MTSYQLRKKNKLSKGIFITLEGGEGAGKTTVIPVIQQLLLQRGLEVLITREPGGIEISEEIRKIILNEKNMTMDARTEALLYAAARRQHLIEKIIPALMSGHVVLCDRFIDSSLAYQGHARALGMSQIWQINQFAVDGWLPDLTFYFDVDPNIGLRRIEKDDKRENNRLDKEKLSFHEKVREGYQFLSKISPDHLLTIDANVSFKQVIAQIETCMRQREDLFLKMSN